MFVIIVVLNLIGFLGSTNTSRHMKKTTKMDVVEIISERTTLQSIC